MTQKGLLFIKLSLRLSELQNTSALSKDPIMKKGAANHMYMHTVQVLESIMTSYHKLSLLSYLQTTQLHRHRRDKTLGRQI